MTLYGRFWVSPEAFHVCAGVASLALILAAPCGAQTAANPISRVTFTHVKPEMLSEWLDLQKNTVMPALKKAGQKSRTVYHTGLFGNSYEYVLISPLDKYADLDAGNPVTKILGQPASSQLGEMLRKCTESQSSFASIRQADASYVLDGPPPALIVSARYRISPGKMADFLSLFKSEVLPVYKKAKVGVTVNARGIGANPNDVTVTTAYSKYADLDGGPFLLKQLGQAGADKINAKFVGVRTLVEVVVRTRVDELSF